MKFIIYVDAAGEFRWHLRAKNGRFVASSGEGFTRADDCLQSINLIMAEMAIGGVGIVGVGDDG